MSSGAVASIVRLDGLTKSFGANVVLDDVTLDVRPGEVHGLLGHNGSGKSTLIKILAGVHDSDAGSVSASGHPLHLPLHPDDMRRHGFAFVHQGLGLAEELTVLDNLAVMDYSTTRLGSIDWSRHAARARDLLDGFGVEIGLHQVVSDLEPVERAIVAIARALAALEHEDNARLLVLDEPTVYLPRERVQVLFDVVRRLRDRGDGILFVSHRLEEALELTDRVSVLREGRLVETRQTEDLTERDLVRLIVGRDLEEHSKDVDVAVGQDDVLSVEGLSTGRLDGVSFGAARGEIVGLAGMPGSGFDDIPYALFGATGGTAGVMRVDGAVVDLKALNVNWAIALGIALIPEDRARLGAALSISLRENLSLPFLDALLAFGRISEQREEAQVASLVSAFGIRAPGIESPLGALSGGNQQKAVLAKWLSQEPRVILMHEPTQGVDVGGRFEIWQHLKTAADAGTAVLVASESAEELAELCDRIIVFRDGHIVAELRGQDVEKHRIVELAIAAGRSAERTTP